MTVSYDFGPEHETKPSANIIAEISKLVDEAAELEQDIADQTEEVAALQRSYDRLVNRDIPAKMDICGVKEITTTSGYKVKLEKQLFASIPSASAINKERDKHKRAAMIKRRNDAIQWLEDNNHGDIVKRELTIQFGKGEADLAGRVWDMVAEQTADQSVHMDESIQVHHKTLAALVSELREQAQVVPEDLLGVHEPSFAKVSR